MIRKFNKNDINRVMTIWLESNIDSHDFVNPDYWKDNYNNVMDMIQQAEVYVYESDDIIKGFIGLDGDYIAGIFVDKLYRSNGIGTALLDFVKKSHNRLILSVYEKNKSAVRFYRKSGFVIQSTGTDSETIQTEYTMSWTDIYIRKAELKDINRILDIYSYYVTDTAVSFEYDVPDEKEFRQRFERISEKYPYIVAEHDNKIVGYAYAHEFVGRKAYERSAELTVYTDRNFHRLGAGRKLYDTLEDILYKMGITNLYACIAVPETDDKYLTGNSLEFHEHMGFKKVGEFHNCGYKFNNWYNMVWVEKIINVHSEYHDSIIYFDDLDYKF